MEFDKLDITEGDAFHMARDGMEHKAILEGFIVAQANPNLRISIRLEGETNVLSECCRCA